MMNTFYPGADDENRTEHNYKLKLLALSAAGKVPRGGSWHTRIAHDDWCGLLHHREFCNCDPDITFVRDVDCWCNGKHTKN